MRYDLVPITKKFKLLGFTCDLLIRDLESGKIIPCSPSNFIYILNGGSMKSLQNNYPQWDDE